jgi:hypothetical protein
MTGKKNNLMGMAMGALSLVIVAVAFQNCAEQQTAESVASSSNEQVVCGGSYTPMGSNPAVSLTDVCYKGSALYISPSHLPKISINPAVVAGKSYKLRAKITSGPTALPPLPPGYSGSVHLTQIFSNNGLPLENVQSEINLGYLPAGNYLLHLYWVEYNGSTYVSDTSAGSSPFLVQIGTD